MESINPKCSLPCFCQCSVASEGGSSQHLPTKQCTVIKALKQQNA